MKLKALTLSIILAAATLSCTAQHSSDSPYPDFTQAAENTINGVVSIKSYATPQQRQQQYSQGYDPLLEYFFGIPQQRQQPRQQQSPKEQQLGLGSGVILSSDGYIATNHHVIQGAERLQVTLNDNSIYDATVIGSDEATDLALLKIDATGLPVIPMGNSDDLRVGEWVLAVGNPFGLTSTVTAGIVSAKARGISGGSKAKMSIESYIQTDAAVNAGNSGGALVNTKGELVGINAAIYSQTGNYAGYSFAIPASIVTKIVADLKDYGTVQRGVLGISFMELTPELAKEKGITETNDGIYVAEVLERSAAFEAGLQKDDIIIEVDGKPTHSGAAFQEQIARKRPGDDIEIAYLRSGKKHHATAKLRNNNGTTTLQQPGDFAELGCALKALDSQELRRLGLTAGLQVTGLTDGKFRDAGIRKGFIIIDVNGQRIRTVEDLEKLYDAVRNSSSDDKVLFITGLYPTGRKTYYAVDLAD
ncbi:MAG: Do family serine endopeptidase [Bacteroides sp.]|nr:Do family serine endopeptidase [Bacteroides sp.]MCM1378560.1 Do family serine endopeptidase [Bacteroides sp.]MCM1444861.1 Do family serine endopeptidase [Prevotella sp.]